MPHCTVSKSKPVSARRLTPASPGSGSAAGQAAPGRSARRLPTPPRPRLWQQGQMSPRRWNWAAKAEESKTETKAGKGASD